METKQQAGFTIVELLIATLVFSVVLLVISMGLIQVGRTFHKGVTITQTQEVARSIVDDIAQAIQFSGGVVTETPPIESMVPKSFCIGGKQYSYVLNLQLTDGNPGFEQSRHVLVVGDKPDPPCGPTSPPPVDMNAPPRESRELMSRNMRLAKLQVACVRDPLLPTRCLPGLYTVTARVAYGDFDLLEDTDADGTRDTCRGGAGSQFCSVSELKTTVQKRVE